VKKEATLFSGTMDPGGQSLGRYFGSEI
jgi:hypothetical protein